MKKTRFTDEQMVTILREADTKPVPEILADHLHATVGRVIEIAKEIDNEYASPADSSWRRPRTGRDSQGAASLQPLDLHTLLKKRPRAADPIVEITGLVVRGVGQSQQRTVSVKLNDESAPAAQLPDVKRVGEGRQTDRVAWYETALGRAPHRCHQRGRRRRTACR